MPHLNSFCPVWQPSAFTSQALSFIQQRGENRGHFTPGCVYWNRACFCFGDTLEHLVSCRSETELRLILTLIKGELRWKNDNSASFIHLHVRPTRRLCCSCGTRKKKKVKKIYTGCSLKSFGTYDVKLQMIKGSLYDLCCITSLWSLTMRQIFPLP